MATIPANISLVAAAVAELYGAEPAGFTARRKSLADEARAAGERDAAQEIAALRKPTRAAWVLNTLARADPDTPGRLAGLAAELRAAAEARDGKRLRELSARRSSLVDKLADRAFETAGIADPSAALRSEVTETLTSAIANPDTARQFAAGTLTRAADWSGFAPFTPPAGDLGAPQVPAGGPKALPPGGLGDWASPPSGDSKRGKAPLGDTAAERIIATATQAAAAAVTREEELEVEVKSLEGRLTEARAELVTARAKARRAEAAERKARQALGHPGG